MRLHNVNMGQPHTGATITRPHKETLSVIPWLEQQYGDVRCTILDHLNRGRTLEVTAELMGISTTTLERLRKHYGIKKVVVWK